MVASLGSTKKLRGTKFFSVPRTRPSLRVESLLVLHQKLKVIESGAQVHVENMINFIKYYNYKQNAMLYATHISAFLRTFSLGLSALSLISPACDYVNHLVHGGPSLRHHGMALPLAASSSAPFPASPPNGKLRQLQGDHVLPVVCSMTSASRGHSTEWENSAPSFCAALFTGLGPSASAS